MFESLDAVDDDDWNVPSVAPDEDGVEVYIYFPESVEVLAIGCQNCLFGLVAKVATRSCVECHLSPGGGVHVGSLAHFQWPRGKVRG